MSAWLKRFGLHLAAAVGATGIFVAAAAVGANQAGQQASIASPTAQAARPRAPAVERSLAGTVREVFPDALAVVGVGGREWRIAPAPGALIRLNGKAARLDALLPGDRVVILGQAQPGPGGRFLAHAITVRRK